MSQSNEFQLQDLSSASSDRSQSQSRASDSFTAHTNDTEQNLLDNDNIYKYTHQKPSLFRRVSRVFLRRPNLKIIIVVALAIFIAFNIIAAFSPSASSSSGSDTETSSGSSEKSFSSIKDYWKTYKNNIGGKVGNSTIIQYIPSYVNIGKTFGENSKDKRSTFIALHD